MNRMKSATDSSVKLDELAHDTATPLEGHRLGIMEAVALKLSKFGGLPARNLCPHLGARMCIDCTWGSAIVTAAALHLGAATLPSRLLNVCDLPAMSARALRRTRQSAPVGALLRLMAPGSASPSTKTASANPT